MKHRTRPHLLACAALLSALAFTTTAVAQSEGAVSAAEHARRAQIAYDLADWTTATKEYEAAYRIDQDAQYLWGLAQAQRLGGKHADAIKSYKAYQRANVSANQANAAEMMITKCEAEIAKDEAKQAEKRAAEQNQTGSKQPEAAPAPARAGSEAGQDRAGGGLGIGWFIAGAALTAGLGGAAIWSGLDTNKKASAYEEKPTRQGYLDGKDLETRTNILIGATAVAGVSTIVIAVFTNWSGSSAPRQEQATRLQLHPSVGPRSGALLATGRF